MAAFGSLSGAALVAVVCAAMVLTLGIETIGHQEELAELRSAAG